MKMNNIRDLILECVNISRQAQKDDALYTDNPRIVFDVHKRYILWKIATKEWLEKQNKRIQERYQDKFYEGDGIPKIASGIDYMDPASTKSQELLKNIETESRKMLGYLKEAQTRITKKAGPINVYYLSNEKRLCKKPESKVSHNLREGGNYCKIFEYLLSNSPYKYHETRKIAALIGKTEDRTRNIINKTNNKIKGKLSLKKNLIVGQNSLGYKVNPAFKVEIIYPKG